MIRKLYDWTYNLSKHPRSFWALFIVAFIESSVFPIPPDVLLIPIIFANRHKALRLAFICTLGSTLGGIFGYGIGYFLYQEIGVPIMEAYNYTDAIAKFSELYNYWGVWIIAAAGFTPFPYKVITITSGVTHFPFWIFVITSILSRGARFYLVAIILMTFGEKMEQLLEKHFNLITTLFFILFFGGFFVVYKFL